ncbi:hypothetical protein PAXRUDRAFT_775811 [Paxillus rubicundulus Ve08.2h10]|uniref:Uncharacterized protein n=1 Tax=Paxillus rubicundulus Ve08.2h10 TaxID=930991 RepID=A0A0D0C3T2_9AGAM|nr:hypothetical protein PAXRUDRAFT_775811 [Paxillus rubicundulus Ve08.2h10]
MHHWYRASGLTIVYFADVSVIEEDVLRRSEWFRRTSSDRKISSLQTTTRLFPSSHSYFQKQHVST